MKWGFRNEMLIYDFIYKREGFDITAQHVTRVRESIQVQHHSFTNNPPAIQLKLRFI